MKVCIERGWSNKVISKRKKNVPGRPLSRGKTRCLIIYVASFLRSGGFPGDRLIGLDWQIPGWPVNTTFLEEVEMQLDCVLNTRLGTLSDTILSLWSFLFWLVRFGNSLYLCIHRYIHILICFIKYKFIFKWDYGDNLFLHTTQLKFRWFSFGYMCLCLWEDASLKSKIVYKNYFPL